MTTDGLLAFGVLLRQFRRAAGLSQEELAERAGLSARAVSSLEQGVRQRPYPHTVSQLAEALRLTAPERAQLVAAALRPGSLTSATDEPGPASVLPAALTSFVGRAREIAEVWRRLETTRLLTLTGTGGVGKTRLALAVAADRSDAYRDGVWFVDLAPLADPGLVAPAVVDALGLRVEPRQPILATLARALAARQLLLVLDNCEHLLAACAELAETLLRGCPALTVLATSRELLHAAGEIVWRVPSLAVPQLDQPATVATVSRYEGVQLFVERATAVRPDFALTPQNAPAVAAICARLDGIPLAIELAAARVTGLSVEQIAARLDQRFRLLTSGSRTALPRQQTLRAAIDWSHDLLTKAEQVLLRRLAIFAGGCLLEAAEAVGGGDDLAEADVLDALLRLVDQSMVQADVGVGGETRYRLLETIRQYALERLDEAGEAGSVRGRHRDWCLALAERAEPGLSGHGQAAWVDRLSAELDNLRLALAWSHGEPDGAWRELRLALALGRFWGHRGSLSEGRAWLEGALARVGPVAAVGGAGTDRAAANLRARALEWAGNMAWRQGDAARNDAFVTEAVALTRALGDQLALSRALYARSVAAYSRGDYTAARADAEEAVVLARAAGDPWTLALALWRQGWLLVTLGPAEDGRLPVEASVALFHAVGDLERANHAFGTLGRLALIEGDLARARAIITQTQAAAEQHGWWRHLGFEEIVLGQIARLEGDDAAARRYFATALLRFRDFGDRSSIAWALEAWGGLAVAEVQPVRAARLFGAAAALREVLGQPRPPHQPSLYEQDLAALRAEMDAAALTAAWADGQALTLDAAIAEALAGPKP